jgi:hypothetical protein
MIAAASLSGLRCTALPVASACLVGDEIFYDDTAPPHAQVRAIWHETIEHLARAAAPTLLDDDPDWARPQYQGWADPRDVRHLTAVASEAHLIEAYPDLDPLGAGLARRKAVYEESMSWHAGRPQLPEPQRIADPTEWGD